MLEEEQIIEEKQNIINEPICNCNDEYKIGDIDVNSNPDWIGKNRVELLPIQYKKQDIINMVGHYGYSRNKGQNKLF